MRLVVLVQLLYTVPSRSFVVGFTSDGVFTLYVQTCLHDALSSISLYATTKP